MTRILVAACILAVTAGCGTSASSKRAASAQDHVYVCHGNKKQKWIRIAAPAVDAHRRHGDYVSTIARKEGARCGDGLAIDKHQRSSRP